MKLWNQSREILRQRVAYAVGDAGFNLYWEFTASFLLFFYTDVAHITAAATALILLAGRLTDLIVGPFIGAFLDHTSSRFGRFRPYLLWISPALAGAFVILYSAPQIWGRISMRDAIVIACIASALFSALYSAANIPYTALLTVITPDEQERTRAVGLRFALAFIAVIAVQTTALRLAATFAHGSSALGWQRVAMLYASTASILFFLCFAGTREVVRQQLKPLQWSEGYLGSLLSEPDLLVLLAAMLLSLSAFACRSAVSIYYVRYVFHREQGVSTFLTASSGAAFCACLLLPFLPSAMLRKRSLALACCGCGAISAVIFYGTTGHWWLTICMQFIFGFCTGALLPILFGLVADLPQHLRVLRNRPVEGLIAAGAILALKLGTLCGTAIAAVALAHAGYQPGIEQTRNTLRTFVFLISFLPAVFLLLTGVTLSLLPSWETDNQRTLSGVLGEFGTD